ncbi:permease [Bacillus mycoides]|uniref:permease n=1 Tax=Bacillus mycoides TaxID=1405 RepID=UPI001C0308C4|nr:permease [Bacillus mycoides]NUC16186.1 permease [Bacillus mycoides]QWG52954.1 permease [Bacillus mycoides]QWG58491.1 permease [Bacillus mycoides]QWG73698.1 permease [Bacillus mycoides]QWH25518.1 permease [Bacillus mycoides]
MFAGHFGLVAVVKTKSPKLPLWALMLSTQLLDVIFLPLYVLRVETIEPINSNGYGEAIIHADYSHSLIGALFIAFVAGIVGMRFWGKRSGFVVGAVVFSHWILDLLVHRADLPLLPGDFGDLPMLGFGLWRFPAISIILECILIAVGGILYFRFTVSSAGEQKKFIARVTGGLVVILLILSLLISMAF